MACDMVLCPDNEVRHNKSVVLAALRSRRFDLQIVQTLESIAHYSNSLNKVHRILARVIRGWSLKDVEKKITNPKALTLIAKEPTADEISRAKNMLLIHAMSDTAEAFTESRLDSLLPLRKGFLIVTTGRLGEGNMSRLFGVSHLPTLMPKSRVAYLYMMLAHRGESGLSRTAVEHHRGVSGT